MNLLNELKLMIYESNLDEDEMNLCLEAVEECTTTDEFYETADDILCLMEMKNDEVVYGTGLRDVGDKNSRVGIRPRDYVGATKIAGRTIKNYVKGSLNPEKYGPKMLDDLNRDLEKGKQINNKIAIRRNLISQVQSGRANERTKKYVHDAFRGKYDK